MRLGYVKIWQSDENGEEKRQVAALRKAGVDKTRVYKDVCADLRDATPGLDSALKALRSGDVLVVSALSRMARDVRQLVRMIDSLNDQKVELVVLNGMFPGMETNLDQATAQAVFKGLVQFDSELRSFRTREGLDTARQFGRPPGRRPRLSAEQVRYAQQFLKGDRADPAVLCEELQITLPTLRRYMSLMGELREVANTVLEQERMDKDSKVSKRKES